MGLATRLVLSSLGLAGLLGLWAAIHQAAGPFVLPGVGETMRLLVEKLVSGEAQAALAVTVLHALLGWLAGGALGIGLGLVAGLWRPAALAAQPAALVLLATPPVAWLVLTVLWFGASGLDSVFTVAVAVGPMMFLATRQGVEARDPKLDEMAKVFAASRGLRLRDVIAPQILSHLLPTLASALGAAPKICVMAEVMASGTGVGGKLAEARANLDLASAMAWIVLIVVAVLALDLILISPLRAQTASQKTSGEA